MFTNKGLVAYAKAMCDYHSPYWYGTWGNICSEQLYQEKRRQYPANYDKWSKSSFVEQYGMKVHDCMGLVKGYLMNPTLGDDGYVKDVMAPSKYIAKYDISANMLEQKATVKGNIKTIPEIIGLIVWKSGHVGVYIGGGYVIEERGHSYGTVKTRLADRPWEKWMKHPDIQYIEEPKPEPKGDTCMIELPVLKKTTPTTKNECVRTVQIILNGKGYRDKEGLPLDVDSKFGGNTKYALEQFQRKNKLAVTGETDKATWDKLLKG